MAQLRDAAKEQYWRGVIQRFEASGLGARRFCDRERISERRLHWWRRTLRLRDGGPVRRPRGAGVSRPRHGHDDQAGDASFLPVHIPFSLGSPIEVVHPRGHVIRVPAVFDPTALGRIMAVIDAPAGASGEP